MEQELRPKGVPAVGVAQKWQRGRGHRQCPYPSLRCEAEKVKWAHKDYGKARLTEQKSVAGRLTQPSILSAQCFRTVSFSTIVNKAQGSL